MVEKNSVNSTLIAVAVTMVLLIIIIAVAAYTVATIVISDNFNPATIANDPRLYNEFFPLCIVGNILGSFLAVAGYYLRYLAPSGDK